ncbi:MAG: cytochrome c [Thermaerobacter sp.]|jgi:mono/diheme cytochrome c family protein|nr:cytochrome c [Thermaerobacter sp.]MDA8144941.1 cytochrome c [Thermaerobacter sp.]
MDRRGWFTVVGGLVVALGLAFLVAALSGGFGNPLPTGPVPAGSAQVSRGARLFAARCASCHGVRGEGGTAPALDTDLFRRTYRDRREVAAYIKLNMPLDRPDLHYSQAADLADYLFSLRGRPS